MDRVLFLVIIILSIFILLFFPIYLDTNLHYDMNRRKLGFGIYGYNFLKIIGGYIATYPGGLALHVSDKKAILVPYRQLKEEQKRFSFIRTFHLKKLSITTETSAEYLMPIFFAQTIARVYFLALYQDINKIKTNFWLKNGDVLLISIHCTFAFNLFMLLKNLLLFIKEKIKLLWLKNIKKSTI